MRIVDLPTGWTIVLDCIAWAIIQPTVAYLSILMPARWFDPDGDLFQTQPWEQEGRIYDRWFRVRRWKDRIPSGGALFQRGFAMHQLEAREPHKLRQWIVETCRSEVCHWLAILPAFLFFLWNPPAVGWAMVLYALAFNLPLVIVQRYNRPRLRAVYRHACRRQIARCGDA
jgi:glycosyl-4,4'-diaponeurosporenoate acyltransferase